MSKQTTVANPIPDYQCEFSRRSIKNYAANFLSPFGYNGLSAMLFNSYLSYVYTSYLGVPVAVISLLMSISIIVDGITDFIMGVVMDRCISKWGKARHWFLISALPTGLCTALMFMVPQTAGQMSKAVYVFVMYNLFCTLCTTVRLPGFSLPALTTDSVKVRSNSAFIMNIGITLGASCVGWILSPLIAANGENLATYRYLSLICGIGVTVSLFLTGLLVTEQRNKKDWELQHAEYRKMQKTEKNESLWDQIRHLVTNRFWLIYMVINFSSTCSTVFCYGAMAYWLGYVVQDMTKAALVYTVMNIPNLIGSILYGVIGRKFSPKAISIVTSAVKALSCGMMWIAGASHFTLYLVFCGLSNFAAGVGYPVANVLIAEIVDYGEWKNGTRQEGLANSGFSVFGMIASSAATAITGLVLAAHNFSGEVTAVSASVVSSINMLYLGVPFFASLLSLVLWFFYRLDSKTVEQCRLEVIARRERLQAENALEE